MDLHALQCACSRMTVTVVRDGIKYTLDFVRGFNTGGLRKEVYHNPSGTSFEFELVPKVFNNTNLPEAFFCNNLNISALLCPGLTCEYTNIASSEKQTFFYPNGIGGFIEQKIEPCKLPVYNHRIVAEGYERYNLPRYEASIEIALGFSLNGGSRICLHNFREISGGLHMQCVEQRICQAINDCFCKEISVATTDRTGGEITFGELQKHMILIISTGCPPHATVWESGSRQRIYNRLLADMAFDTVSTHFLSYVFEHKEALTPIIVRILHERKDQ